MMTPDTRTAVLPTAYTRLVGIDHPIVQEGMGPFDTSHLAASVSEAGGLGTVSVPGTAGDLKEAARRLRASIEDCAERTDRPFAVNIPVGHSRSGEIAPFASIYLDEVFAARRADPALHAQLTVLTTSAGFPTGVTQRVHDEGMLHQHKVGATRHAIKAAEAGVDAIIASGLEMGGHAPASGMHSFVLLPNVADAVDVPILLSGGVRDARGLAAALCLGADAVAMGTRFAASTDNPQWHPAYGDAILGAGEGDDMVFDGVFGPCRVLRNEVSSDYVRRTAEGRPPTSTTKIDAMRRAQIEGDTTQGLVLLGQVASGIRDLVTVSEFLPDMAAGAARIITAGGGHAAATDRSTA